MQEPYLKLKEIIWEVTRKCLNGCLYCGSNCTADYEVNTHTILSIADKICEYPPESIDISGGDPLLVPYGIQKEFITKFKDVGMLCKLIVNLKSFKDKDVEIFNLYDAVGVSVNDKNDLKLLVKLLETYVLTTKITVVSNFNKNNFFDFDEIKKVVKRYDLIWQLQYTIYKEQNELAIYQSDNAVKALSDKIFEAQNENVSIVLADNMTSSPCTAGKYSIGILDNGQVVPCLSMRSWAKEPYFDLNNTKAYPDLLETDASLEAIWINGFKEQRFCEFICCKDVCFNKAIGVNLKKSKELNYSLEELKVDDDSFKIPYPNYPSRDNQPIVLMYGIQTEPTCVYACPVKIDTEPYINITTTSSSSWPKNIAERIKGDTNES